MAGSRRCPRCTTQWPYRSAYMTCPLCGVKTGWSSAPAEVTKEAQAKADMIIGQVAELERDIACLEHLDASSDRLLSFPDALNHWPTASDVAELHPWGRGEAEARPA